MMKDAFDMAKGGCGKRKLGFSLIEVVLALSLMTFVLVAIIGLFSVGLSGTRDSEQKIDAANLATKIISERQAAPTNALPALAGRIFVLPEAPAILPTSPDWTKAPSLVGPGGYTAMDESGAYQLNFAYWTDTNSASATYSRLVKLSVILSSPPAAPLDKATTRYEVTTSYFQP